MGQFWKKYRGLIIFGIVVIILFLLYRFYINNLIPVLISFITLLVIIRYVKEVYRQSEALLRPYLKIQWFNPTKENNKEGIIQIVNIGKGPAIKIKFNPLICMDQNLETKFQIKKIPAIGAGKYTTINKNQIDITGFLGERKKNFTNKYIKKYLEGRSDTHYEIKATYEDLEKTKFTVVFKADENYNDGFGISSQNKS